MKVVFGNSGRLFLAFWLARSAKSAAGCLLPCVPSLLAFRVTLAHVFKIISTYCLLIHSVLLKSTNGSQLLNVSKKTVTTFSQWRGPSRTCFRRFLPPDNGPMLLRQKPSHPYFLPLVEFIKVGLRHPLGKLLQGEFVLLQADWWVAFSTAQVRGIITHIICIVIIVGNLQQWGYVDNPCDNSSRGSAGSWNLFVGSLIRGLPGVPEGGPGGGSQLEDTGRWTQLWTGGPGRTLAAPGDNGLCPENCGGGNIGYPP